MSESPDNLCSTVVSVPDTRTPGPARGRVAAWRRFGDSIATSGVLSVAGQAVTSATTFLTAVMIGRACSKEELGVYVLAMSIVMLMRGVQGELIAAPFTVRGQRREGRELDEFSGSVVVHQLVACLLALVGSAALLGLLLLGLGPRGLLPAAWVLLPAMPLMLMRCFGRHYCFARFRFGLALGLDLLASGLQLGLLSVLYLSGRLGPATALLSGAASAAVFCHVWYRSQASSFRPIRSRFWSDWKSNWGFARWALSSQLIGSSTPYVMPWVVQACHGEASTGTYAVCTTLIGLSHMFVCGVGNVLTPRATRSYCEGGVVALRGVLRQATLVLVLPLSAVVLSVAALGDRLPVFVFGAKFAGLGTVCLLLSISAVVNSVAVVMGNGLWAIDRPRVNMWGDAATLVATALAAAALVPPFGLAGAATATLIGATSGAVVRAASLIRCMKSADVVAPRSRSFHPRQA